MNGLAAAALLCAALSAGLPAQDAAAPGADLQGVAPVSEKAQALWRQGSDSLEAGRFSAAVAAFEQALGLSPDFHDALYSLALARRKSGDFARAVVNFQELIRISPQMMEAWYEMGLCYASLGEYGKAADAYRMALSYNEGCGVCRCALALAARERLRREESLKESEACVALLPDYGGGWNLLGIARMDRGEFAAAAGHFRRAVELSPSYANAWSNLASALRGLGRGPEAEAAAIRACELRPSMENYVDLGEIRLRRGDLAPAKAAFEKALALKPGAAEPHWGLARYYRRKGLGRAADREEARYRLAAGQARGDEDYASEPTEDFRKADLQALVEAWEGSHASEKSQP